MLNPLNDSKAVSKPDRILSQHQAALNHLITIVQNPDKDDVNWLDIGCGQGHPILHLDNCIDEDFQNKINYFGVDLKQDYVQMVRKKCSQLNLKSNDVKVVELSNISSKFIDKKFDFITLINIIHELNPRILSEILIWSILHLNNDGVIYVHDLEKLEKPEFGAITYTNNEIRKILNELYKLITDKTPQIIVSKWKYSTTTGWSFSFKKSYYDIDDKKLKKSYDKHIKTFEKIVEKILSEKLEMKTKLLISVTEDGYETDEEKNDADLAILDFWALKRALEKIK